MPDDWPRPTAGALPASEAISARVLIFASVTAATAAVAAAGALLGSHALPTADDFSSHVIRRGIGTDLEYVKLVYMTWSGRIFSTYLVALGLRLFESLPVISAGFGLLFCVLGFINLSVLDTGMAWRGTRWGFRRPGTIVLVTATTSFFALRPFLGQCVFWFTGGIVYLLPLVLVLGWLAVMRWGSRWWVLRTPAGLILWGVASALVGTAHEQLTGPALVALVGLWFGVPGRGSRTDRLHHAVGVVGFVVGTAVLFLAPGNFARAQVVGATAAGTLAELGTTLRRLRFETFNLGPPAIAWGIVTALILAPLYERRPDHSDRRFMTWWPGLTFLGMATASLVPLLAVPRFISTRTFFFFACFLYLSAFALVRSLLTVVAGHAALAVLATVIGISVLGTWGHWMTNEIAAAARYRSELAGRYAYLRSVAGSQMDIVVPPLANRPPASLHLSDLRKDPAYWINRSVARFYGVRSIRLSD